MVSDFRPIFRTLGLLLIIGFPLVIGTVGLGSLVQEQAGDADAKKVMALMRLKHIDVQQRPKLKEVVLRHMERVADESEWLSLAERFGLSESTERLLAIAQDSPQQANAARALAQVQKLGEMELIYQVILETLVPLDANQQNDETAPQTVAAAPNDELPSDIRRATALAGRLRLLSDQQVAKWLVEQLSLADRYPLPVARAMVDSTAALPGGAEQLLNLAQTKQLPSSIRLAVAAQLSRSSDPKIVEQAGAVLPLPKVANQVLPPMEQLIKLRGDAANGKKIFAGVGTCSKCHVVNGVGSAVGPDLSEIGSKLARDAMYTSVLDPSAAISHNYENHAVQTLEGKLLVGLLVSETADKVTLRSADGVPLEILRDDIDEMQRLKISLMPADLTRNMSVQELADLVEYMTTLKKAN